MLKKITKERKKNRLAFIYREKTVVTVTLRLWYFMTKLTVEEVKFIR
jgi:hypothetical protein